MSGLLADLRVAWRGLRASPGFALASVLALALGIGATAAIFTVVDGVLLRPLPYPDAGRLVFVWEKAEAIQLPRMWVAYPNFLDWRERQRVFEGIAAFGGSDVGLTGEGDPERVTASWTSAELFDVLGVRPALGRGFTPADDTAGAPFTAVLGHGLWQRRFGGDPGVLGRTIELEGDPYTVVGVMPRGFEFATLEGAGIEVWVALGPLAAADPESLLRTNHWLTTVARLRPGVTPERARAEMTRLAAELRELHPENFDDGVQLVRVEDELLGGARRPLAALMAAVVLLLAIACANVAGLALARSTTRARDVSVRAALGAGTGRIAREVLTESVLLALAGGLLGVLLAGWGVEALLALSPESLPRAEGVGLNLRALAFALAVAVATGLLFGLAPALRAARAAPAAALREGSGRATGGSADRVRRALVVGELALALVLLAGAALLVRSLERVVSVDPGFETRDVLLAPITLPAASYDDAEAQAAFYRTALERVRALPGVVSASLVTDPPLSGFGRQTGLRVQGILEPPPGELAPLIDVHSVAPDYFATLGIPLRAGRDFTSADAEDAPLVAIVDESIARRWRARGAGGSIGGRVGLNLDEEGRPVWREVVGVAAPVKAYGLDADARPRVYVPWFQDFDEEGTIAVRTRGDSRALAPAVRQALREVDPDLALGPVQRLDALLAATLAPRRLTTVLLAAFAASALLLACLGTYGLIAYALARRTREIGLRVALGATPGRVLLHVIGQGMTLVFVAVVLGMAGALAVSRLVAGLLFGVSPRDPATLVAVAGVLAVVALLATWIPARRALRIEPAAALRHE